MPRMEVIKRRFVTYTELKRGVKIANFSARTVCIDLENEYDHITIWTRQFMYILGQMMKPEACTHTFNPA